MAFRCSRRRRANSEPTPRPPPPPPRRDRPYTVIIPVKMPSYSGHEHTEPKVYSWVKDYLKEKEKLPSSFEIHQEVKKWPESEDALWDATLSVAFDCTERVAVQWLLGESIDDDLAYRNPDPPPPFDDKCIYQTIHGKLCAICQNAEEGDKVGLWSCRCTYHEECLRKAYKYSTKCPVCGAAINDYTTIRQTDGDIVVEVFV